jgi:hypothetical protein
VSFLAKEAKKKKKKKIFFSQLTMAGVLLAPGCLSPPISVKDISQTGLEKSYQARVQMLSLLFLTTYQLPQCLPISVPPTHSTQFLKVFLTDPT